MTRNASQSVVALCFLSLIPGFVTVGCTSEKPQEKEVKTPELTEKQQIQTWIYHLTKNEGELAKEAQKNLTKKGAKAVPHLAKILPSRNYKVEKKILILKILEKLGPKATPAIPAMIKSFDRSNLKYTQALKDALSRVAYYQPRELLKGLKTKNTVVQNHVAETFVKMGDSGIATLAAGLETSGEETKVRILYTLGRMKSNVLAVDPLVTALGDRNMRVRRAAVDNLRAHGSNASTALPRLYRMKEEYKKDPEIAELINTAIKEIKKY